MRRSEWSLARAPLGHLGRGLEWQDQMCGIVGYVGEREATQVIVEGLQRLEYRGYDSAGIAIAAPGGDRFTQVRRSGKLAVLREELNGSAPRGHLGIGHTRWATHGPPSDENAHPHLSEDGRLALVHNGIIENHLELRHALEARGHRFSSQTDSEVLVHLIEEEWQGDLAGAVRRALARVRGSYALVVAHLDSPGLVAARSTSPLVVGLGQAQTIIASDPLAFLNHTREALFLEDGQVATIDGTVVTVTDLQGTPVEVHREHIEWDAEAAEKAGYPHYMLKEICEQPEVLRQTLGGRLRDGSVELDLHLDPGAFDRIVIAAAGSACYAGTVGEYLIEALARVPVEVELASEFRSRAPVLDVRTLFVVVSQSGETIDTLEALRAAKRQGARTLGILNVKGSTISREVDDVLYIHAGPEIGVASTKAYLAMVCAFQLLGLWLGTRRGTLEGGRARELTAGLACLPAAVERVLALRPEVARLAQDFMGSRDFIFLGRGINYPTALEGALKLKEISYIHAEAFASGELKHGPIALIDEHVPVVVLATASPLYEKVLSAMQEVRARKGVVIAVANEGDELVASHADHVIRVPEVPELISPAVNVVPLQLLAYEIARMLGRDVDQPRNLAKSVTVE